MSQGRNPKRMRRYVHDGAAAPRIVRVSSVGCPVLTQIGGSSVVCTTVEEIWTCATCASLGVTGPTALGNGPGSRRDPCR